ncbi:MAG: CBS domain-containing protein [Bdellovibrionales bacterium]|nr:CBS domain-containing protein [Bdellovibrionales bacterium]
MIANEVMTRKPVSIKSSAAIRDAIRMLYELDFRHLPVLDDGELVGMVSDRDLKSFQVSYAIEQEDPNELISCLDKPIHSVMQTEVVTVNPETDLVEVIEQMIGNKIGAIPVVELVSGNLCGIISYIDILKVAKDALAD